MNNTRPIIDHYTRITADIVRQLEQGVRPWHQPWKLNHAAVGISRPLRSNGEAYHGINVVVLWLTAFEKQYVSPLWVTFQQAKEFGGFVKKGEKGTGIVYANSFEKKEIDHETGEEMTERIPFLKSYTVFNAEQVEGLPEKFYAKVENPLSMEQRLEIAEMFFARTKADIRYGGGKAYYRPGDDFVQIPPFESFTNRESYYSTLDHECTHALGIPAVFSWRDGGFVREMLRDGQPTAGVTYERDGQRVHLPTVQERPGTRLKFPQQSADLSTRWCSAYLKIDVMARVLNNDPAYQGKKILVMTGERREESSARSKYEEVEKHRTNSRTRRVDHWRPVIGWPEKQVWELIEMHRARPHPAYLLGYGRVSCMNCIFADEDLMHNSFVLIRHPFRHSSSINSSRR